MAVSRRLRFEVLRRDEHTCRYCGASAPDVALTVDHVIPVALGGADDPTNLVTACSDCNSGKSSISPDSPVVADVKRDAMRWAAAMRYAALERENAQVELDRVVTFIDETWSAWHYGTDKLPVPRSNDWRESIERFYKAGLPADEIARLVRVAMSKDKVKPGDTWTYFCGCCWRAIDDLQARARQMLEEDPEGFDSLRSV